MFQGNCERVALIWTQNSEVSLPLRLPLLLSAYLSCNASHARRLYINNFIILVSSYDFIATFLLIWSEFYVVVRFFFMLDNEIVVVLDLPSARSHLEQEISELPTILPVRHRTCAAERPVNDCHVSFWADVTCGNAAQRSTIDTNFPLDFHFIPYEVVHGINVLLHGIGRWRAMWPTICSVVPREDVYTLFKEELKVEGVWNMHHLLVEHGVWVAQDDSRSVFIIFLKVGIVCWFEEHTIELAAISWLDPVVICVELLLEDCTKLLDFSEKQCVEEAAWGSFRVATAAASQPSRNSNWSWCHQCNLFPSLY